jgi:hypothetical protein
MYTNEVSKNAFKAKALEFFHLVESSGESLIVIIFGKPSIEVEPFCVTGRHLFDILRGSMTRYDKPTGSIAIDEWVAAQ